MIGFVHGLCGQRSDYDRSGGIRLGSLLLDRERSVEPCQCQEHVWVCCDSWRGRSKRSGSGACHGVSSDTVTAVSGAWLLEAMILTALTDCHERRSHFISLTLCSAHVRGVHDVLFGICQVLGARLFQVPVLIALVPFSTRLTLWASHP